MDDSNNVSDEEVVVKMKDTTEKEKGEHRIIICTGQLEEVMINVQTPCIIGR